MLTIYSLPNCSKCDMAKNIAKSKGIEYSEANLADADVRKTVEDLYAAAGTPMPREAPIIVKDNELMMFNQFRTYAYTQA